MKKQTNKTADQYGLEGDGIIENFFHLLWTKDPLFGTIPSVYVPHTVVIKYSQPMSWYFMKDGALKKKTKKNLTIDHIKEIFLKNKTPSGVVAVFMRYTPDEKGEDTKVVFEYFDEKEFCKRVIWDSVGLLRIIVTFINDKWTMNHGILQQFIQPKGDNNYLIRANWSPKLCLFEKVESVSKINDKKLDIYDRVLTFEAENFHSRERPLRGYVLPNKIQRICANISQHVQNVSFESILIARMILHFKVDENSRIWLLLCTSLRIDQGDDEDKVLIKQKVRGEEIVMNYKPEDYLSKIGVSDNIRTDIIKGKPVNMHKIYTCTNCAKHIEPNLVAEATYKTIIEGYEWDHLREKDRSKENAVIKANPDNLEEMLEKLMRRANHSEHTKIVDEKVTSLVPPLIKKIYPRLKDEMYKTLKNDVAFLKKTALFCEDCILHIQQSNEENLKSQKHINDFYGTGRLKPESLKFRHVHTMKNIHVSRPHTNNNFFKFRSPSDTRNLMHSARHSHVRNQSDLPIIFGDIKSIKTIKTLNSENDEVIDSGAESGGEDGTSRRRTPIKKSSLRINPANLALDSIKTQRITKQTSRTVNSSPFRSNFPLLSAVTSRPSMMAEELIKRENLLTAGAGLGYAQSTTSRKSSQGGFSKENLGTTQTTQYTTLTHTLDAYMPKMRFLKSDYEALRGNFISPSKGSDTLEKVFEEENKKALFVQTVKNSAKKKIKMKSVDLRGAYKHVIDI